MVEKRDVPMFLVGAQVKWKSDKYDQNTTGKILDVNVLDVGIEYLVEWPGGTGWQPEANLKAA